MKLKSILTSFMLSLMILSSCSNKDYFEDSGVHDPRFYGNMMAYLESKAQRPEDPFDTLVQIIRYAGMEDILKNDQITFFAPPDPTFEKALNDLNLNLYMLGKDTIQSYKDVKPEVYRRLLSEYIIKGDYGLTDFKQVDTVAKYAFGGQIYQTYSEDAAINVGVVFHDLKNGDATIKYGGPRQLMVSYVPDFTNPTQNWISTFVASSNIQPDNGRVHVLNYRKHIFGYMGSRFTSLAIELGIDYNTK
ncbi:fasciclin domain-containing protein [Sphingobacterium siyangense]|uniref:fasciclin domain-containing protein n=1 Tax=Sphingobacterium siyangense TaxID=459529 RepID=UPI003C7533EC